MANRRKLVARKNYSTNKKDKRTKKDEGNVLQTEVQRYKDREKETQLEDGPSVSKRRLSMHQGMYNHGRTSGKVQRDFGLSKEAKARAEANLTRILELASNGSEDSQHRKLIITSSSSKNSSSEIIEPSQDVNEKEAENTAEKIEERKSCPSLKEEALEEEDLKTALCERLLIGARHGIDKKSQQLASHGKILKSLLNEIKSQVKNSSEAGVSRHSPCGVTRKLLRLQEKQRLSSRLVVGISKDEKRNMLNPTKCIDGTPELKSLVKDEADVLKTPLSKDFLKLDAEVETDGENAEQHSLHTSLLDSTCSSTNIMSPRALLIRYEENLKRKNDISHSRHSSSEFKGNCGFGAEHFRKQKRGSDVTEKCDVNNIIRSSIVGRKSYGINDENTHIFASSHGDSVKVFKPDMEKSVVVNPLDYIERYEQQTITQQRMDISMLGGAVDHKTELRVSSSTCPASANGIRILLEACPNGTVAMKNHGSGVIKDSVESVDMWQKHADPGNEMINPLQNMYAGDPGCETVNVTSGQSPCRCHKVSASVRTASHSDSCDMGVLNDGCNKVHHPGTSVCASYTSEDGVSVPGQPHYSNKQNAYRTENPNLHSSKLSVNHIIQNCSEKDLIFPLSQRTSDPHVHISDQQHSNLYLGSDMYSINQQSRSDKPFERSGCDVNKDCGSSDTQLISEGNQYQACCSDVDSLEELSKDYIFQPHRQEYSSFYLQGARKARRCRVPWEEQFQSLSYGEESSAYINALNSTSQSTQNSPVDPPCSFHTRQHCFGNYGNKQSLVNSFENCKPWQLPERSQPCPQQVQVFKQPLQYDDHRFYHRKLD